MGHALVGGSMSDTLAFSFLSVPCLFQSAPFETFVFEPVVAPQAKPRLPFKDALLCDLAWPAWPSATYTVHLVDSLRGKSDRIFQFNSCFHGFIGW